MTSAEKSLALRIKHVMSLIRNSPRPLVPGPSGEAKASETWEGNLDGRPADRLVIYLRSSGCGWAMNLKKPYELLPGCLDCEHSVAGTTYGAPITAEDYLKQFLGKFENYKSRNCPILCLYNEGSFFNEDELPPAARRQILKRISADGHVRRLIVESLPNYLNDKVLMETRELLGAVELEVGVGLESCNNLIRSLCINKPYTLEMFEKIAPLVKNYGRLLAYVLLKPSFLTEKEAIDDTIATAKYAFHMGADAVSLEPVSIGRFTMSGVLHYLGLYNPAWLWSVLECARATTALGEVRIGGYQFAPTYIYHATNCSFCTESIKTQIRRFNETYNRADLDKISCGYCFETWQAELNRTYPPLTMRIAEQLDKIESFLVTSDLYSILGQPNE